MVVVAYHTLSLGGVTMRIRDVCLSAKTREAKISARTRTVITVLPILVLLRLILLPVFSCFVPLFILHLHLV